MPRTPKPARSIDPRSNATVLFFTGRPTPRDVPARDLHGGDLARILYVRAHVELAGGRPAPARSAQLEALADELVASGAFLIGPIPEVPAQPGKEIT